MIRDEDALARMARIHHKVWRPSRWLWEAVTLGVVLAGLSAFVWAVALIIAAQGGAPALLAALHQ